MVSLLDDLHIIELNRIFNIPIYSYSSWLLACEMHLSCLADVVRANWWHLYDLSSSYLSFFVTEIAGKSSNLIRTSCFIKQRFRTDKSKGKISLTIVDLMNTNTI